MNCDNRISRLQEIPAYAGLDNRIDSLRKRGRTIRAIFILRAITGMSLQNVRHYLLNF
jgi:hypothetical protein